MTLGSTPTIPQILAEIGKTLPYTFPDGITRWLADVASTDPIIFPTSFANKISIKVVDSIADAGGSSPHTFSGVNFGAAFTGRVLVACTCLRENGSNPLNIPTNGVTIGGVTASGDDNGNAGASGPGIGAGIAAASVPTGTSGDVVVSWSSATANAAGLILLSVANMATTASDAGSAGADQTGGTGASCTLDIPASGVLIAACAHTNTNDETLTGVTERAAINVGSGRLSVGFDNRLSVQTAKSISASWSGNALFGLHARSYTQT